MRLFSCLLLASLLACGHMQDASAQRPLSIYRYAVEPADYRYLWYGEVTQNFDTASVKCTFGEVQLVRSGLSTPLNLRLTEDQWFNEHSGECTPGSAQSGRDDVLEEFVRTEPFVLNAKAEKITFLRMIEASEPCSTGHECKVRGPSNWRESLLALSDTRWITDEFSFVVELVNASRKTVTTIDSIRIHRGSVDQCILASSGSSIMRVEHEYKVPPNNIGDTVYLRLVPYRFGNSGQFSALLQSERIERSALYGDTTVPSTRSPRWFQVAVTDSVNQIYLDKILAYYRQHPHTCKPVVFGLSGIPANHYQAFMDSLKAMNFSDNFSSCSSAWQSDSAVIRLTLYPDYNPNPKPSSPYVPALELANRFITNGSMVGVKRKFKDAKLTLSNLRAEPVRELWTGTGPANVRVDLQGVEPGSYRLVLESRGRGSTTSETMPVIIEP